MDQLPLAPESIILTPMKTAGPVLHAASGWTLILALFPTRSCFIFGLRDG